MTRAHLCPLSQASATALSSAATAGSSAPSMPVLLLQRDTLADGARALKQEVLVAHPVQKIQDVVRRPAAPQGPGPA